MRWLSAIERRTRRRRLIMAGAGVLVALGFLSALDGPVFRALYVGASRVADVEGHDWYRLFRSLGYLPTWLIIGAALMLVEEGRGRGIGARVIAGATLSGAGAELLKLVVGRQRPINNHVADGAYVFRGLIDRFSTHEPLNLGMPSSHAAVAFAGAFLLAFAYPRSATLMVLAAVGCAATRLVTGAHFLTDVFVGAVLAYAIARALRPGGWNAGRRLLLP